MARIERGEIITPISPDEIEIQRNTILGPLKQKFEEWGYSPSVLDEIINWGWVSLYEGDDEEGIIGFELTINDKDRLVRTQIVYFHPDRTAEIWKDCKENPEAPFENFFQRIIPDVMDIKLEEWGRRPGKRLCLRAKAGENYWNWKFVIRKNGWMFPFQEGITVEDYLEESVRLLLGFGEAGN